MDKAELDKRLNELGTERERLMAELEKARTEARDNLIAGKKLAGTAAALAERISIVDDAIAELTERLGAATDSVERNNRRRRAEAALDATAKRVKLASAVDEALTLLAASWTAYSGTLRKEIGQVSSAGGDVNAVRRALTNNRVAEPLIKALISAGGPNLIRSFGIDTPIRDRHAITLQQAEERVAESLRTELLRVIASSPQPNVSREAQAELDQMETNNE